MIIENNSISLFLYHLAADVGNAESAIFFLPEAPCTILSIPIIRRLIAKMNVKRSIPTTGFTKTIIETPIDSIPTAIRNILDHFEVSLFVTP